MSFSETITFFTVNLLIHFLFSIILVFILPTQKNPFRGVKPSVVIATVQNLMIVIAIFMTFVIDSNPGVLTVIMWTQKVSSEKPLGITDTRSITITVHHRNKNVFRSFLPISRIFSKINHILRQLQPILVDDPYISTIFPLPPIISYRQPPKPVNLLVHSKFYCRRY